MYSIRDEKYEKEFIFLRKRKEDGKWFFFTTMHQYYITCTDAYGPTPWLKVHGVFYTEEEMVYKTLKGDRLYRGKDKTLSDK